MMAIGEFELFHIVMGGSWSTGMEKSLDDSNSVSNV